MWEREWRGEGVERVGKERVRERMQKGRKRKRLVYSILYTTNLSAVMTQLNTPVMIYSYQIGSN